MSHVNKQKKCSPNNAPADSAKIRAVLLRLLAKRDYAYHELVTKLTNRGYPLADILELLDAFKEKGYLDDNRFATHYVTYRKQRGFGPKRIALELKTRGIDDSIIAEKTKIADNDWLNEMQVLLMKRVKNKPLCEPKQKAKLVRFFLNRGFTQAQIIFLFKEHLHYPTDNAYETE